MNTTRRNNNKINKKNKNKKNKRKNNTKKVGGTITDDLVIFLLRLKTYIFGPLWNSFSFILSALGTNILWIGAQVYGFISYLWRDITMYGLKSNVLRTILIIFGVLSSFYLVGLGLTSFNIFGLNSIITGWGSALMSVNIFNIIYYILITAFNVLGTSINTIWNLLFHGPLLVSSFMYIILITGVGLPISIYIAQYIAGQVDEIEIVKLFGKHRNNFDKAYYEYMENYKKTQEEISKQTLEQTKEDLKRTNNIYEDFNSKLSILQASIKLLVSNSSIENRDQLLKEKKDEEKLLKTNIKNIKEIKDREDEKIIIETETKEEEEELKTAQKEFKTQNDIVSKIRSQIQRAINTNNIADKDKLSKELDKAVVVLNTKKDKVEKANLIVADRTARKELKITKITHSDNMKLIESLPNEDQRKHLILNYMLDVIKDMLETANIKIEEMIDDVTIDISNFNKELIEAIYDKYQFPMIISKLTEEDKQMTDKIVGLDQDKRSTYNIKLSANVKQLKSIYTSPYTKDIPFKYDAVPEKDLEIPFDILTILKDIIKKGTSVGTQYVLKTCRIDTLVCIGKPEIAKITREYLEIKKNLENKQHESSGFLGLGKTKPPSKIASEEHTNDKKDFLSTLEDDDKDLLLTKFKLDMLEQLYTINKTQEEKLFKSIFKTTDQIIRAIYFKVFWELKAQEMRESFETLKAEKLDRIDENEKNGYLKRLDSGLELLKDKMPTELTFTDYEYHKLGYYLKDDTDMDQYTFTSDTIKLLLSFNKDKKNMDEYFTLPLSPKNQILKPIVEKMIVEIKQFQRDMGGLGMFYFGGGNEKKSLSDKIQNLSTKKMADVLNSIPKENIEKVKEENPIPFFIGSTIGFVKETETGFEFSEEGIKTMKKILQHSVSMADKHCPKGKDCTKSKKNNETQKKHNKSQKSTEVLTYEDVVELKELLSSLEFVHMANIHSAVRENTNDVKTGGINKKKYNPKTTLSHIKGEDLNWLGEKHPEKYKSAKKLGFLNNQNELTAICSNIIEDSTKINGIDINKEYYKPMNM
jgi:hypothetical protein